METSTIFDLTGKRALVTGGATGIGLAIAGALADFGADVCLWGRKESHLAEGVAKIGHVPGRITAAMIDVTDEIAVARGMDAIVAEFGGLEIVAINAGVSGVAGPFVQSSTSNYRTVMATNLDGAYWTMREAARVMIPSGAGGSIIAISSLAATEGATHNQAYGASKAGVLAMANGAAVELARHSIRVNTIIPGWVATDMSRANQESERFTSNVISRVPLRRWGQPADFAGAAVFLASDASKFQTGSALVIDGGYSLF